MPIEGAFGRLKGIFGILRRPLDTHLSDVPELIHSCFILHNICESKREQVNEQRIQAAQNYDLEFQPASVAIRPNTGNNNENAKRIRNIFVEYFN